MGTEAQQMGASGRERKNTPNVGEIVDDKLEKDGAEVEEGGGDERKEIKDAFDGLAELDSEFEGLLASVSLTQKALAGRIGSVKEFVREGGFKNTEKALEEDETLFEKV